MQEAVILPQARLREHQDQMEALLQIARHGLESLYSKVAGLGYVVLLTDARGVTVDFLGDLVFEPSLRKAGLYLARTGASTTPAPVAWAPASAPARR